MMKKRMTALVMAAAMASVSIFGTGSLSALAASADEKIVNVAFTDQFTSLNPLDMDVTFINLYSISMSFLPLFHVGEGNVYTGALAESITTEDNQTFDVILREEAVWSDGEPVTTDDVIYTILKMTSPAVANPNYDFTMFEGINEANLSEEGATGIPGLKKIDDKHMQFIANTKMNLNTFLQNVGTWICIVPSHVLADVPDSELLQYEWFNHPDVVSGPYQLIQRGDRTLTFAANENYFRGKPIIDTINFRIVDGPELLSGLQTGTIDLVHPSCSIPSQDRDAVEALENVTSFYTDALTNEMTFINTKTVPDARVRRAIVEAIDRQTLVAGILQGHGEVAEGFVPSGSPLYDESKGTIPYDPAHAKELLAEAGWDGSQTLQYYIPSSDSNVVLASQIVQQQLAEVGISIEINTVDFGTLMEIAGKNEFDIFSVQYTITPTDYWADENSLVNAPESWTGGWMNETVSEKLDATQTEPKEEDIKAAYLEVDKILMEEVPMFSLYFQSNMAAVNNRVANASPTFYGTFNNVYEWDVE